MTTGSGGMPRIREIQEVVSRHNGVRIADVQKVVCEVFGVTRDQLVAGNRDRRHAPARQKAVLLARELCGKSYPQLARAFGYNDHASAIHACRRARVASLCPDVGAALDRCREQIVGIAASRSVPNNPEVVHSLNRPIPRGPKVLRLPSPKRVSTAIDQADWLSLGGELA